MLSNNGPKSPEYYLDAIAAAAATAPEPTALSSESEAAAIRDAIDVFSKLAKAAEADRKATKEPYLEQGRKIDASFKPVAARADAEILPRKAVLTAYLAEQERRKREEAAAAARAAAEAARLAEAMKEDAFAGDCAAEMAACAERDAAYAAARAAQNTIKGSSDRAMGLRTVRKARVVDPAALVAHYAAHPDVVALCERLANAVIRASRGAPIAIPGVEVAEEKTVA